MFVVGVDGILTEDEMYNTLKVRGPVFRLVVNTGIYPGFMWYRTSASSHKQITVKIPNILAINSQTG